MSVTECLPLDPICNQFNSPYSYINILKINLNNILPAKLRFPKRLVPQDLLSKMFVCISHFFSTCSMSSSFCPSFNHSNSSSELKHTNYKATHFIIFLTSDFISHRFNKFLISTLFPQNKKLTFKIIQDR
jgi:hypothetical protein